MGVGWGLCVVVFECGCGCACICASVSVFACMKTFLLHSSLSTAYMDVHYYTYVHVHVCINQRFWSSHSIKAFW